MGAFGDPDPVSGDDSVPPPPEPARWTECSSGVPAKQSSSPITSYEPQLLNGPVVDEYVAKLRVSPADLVMTAGAGWALHWLTPTRCSAKSAFSEGAQEPFSATGSILRDAGD